MLFRWPNLLTQVRHVLVRRLTFTPVKEASMSTPKAETTQVDPLSVSTVPSPGLVPAAMQWLAHEWSVSLSCEEVRVNLRERAVFDGTTAEGETVVVKVSWTSRGLAAERLLLGHARAAGVPAPQVLRFVSGSPTVLVMAKIDGAALSATSSGDPLWQQVGRALKGLHSVPVPPRVPPFDPRDRDWARFMQLWVHEAAQRARKQELISHGDADRLHCEFADYVTKMPSPVRVLLHGDCQPDHFLISDDRVAGMVDFGDARVGDPTWDIAVLTMNAPGRLDAVLDGYAPDAQLRDHFERWLPAYRLLRQLGALCWRVENDLPHAREVAALRERLSRPRPWLP